MKPYQEGLLLLGRVACYAVEIDIACGQGEKERRKNEEGDDAVIIHGRYLGEKTVRRRSAPTRGLFDFGFGSLGVALEVNPSHDELVAFFEIRTFKLVFEDRVFGKELAC